MSAGCVVIRESGNLGQLHWAVARNASFRSWELTGDGHGTVPGWIFSFAIVIISQPAFVCH